MKQQQEPSQQELLIPFCIGKYNGGLHFAFSCLILRICCFIISFTYCCCISVLAEVDMDCIICVDMPVHPSGQEAGKCIMETLCFCFCCISVFSTSAVVVDAECLCHSFHHLMLFLSTSPSLSQQDGSPMNQHLPYTSCWSHHLKKRPWRSLFLGQTRIGTWANCGQTHSNGRT